MEITINQQLQTVTDNCTLLHLLETALPQPNGVAVAVNNTIVPKTTWSEYFLNPNDKVTIIRATQGG